MVYNPLEVAGTLGNFTLAGLVSTAAGLESLLPPVAGSPFSGVGAGLVLAAAGPGLFPAGVLLAGLTSARCAGFVETESDSGLATFSGCPADAFGSAFGFGATSGRAASGESVFTFDSVTGLAPESGAVSGLDAGCLLRLRRDGCVSLSMVGFFSAPGTLSPVADCLPALASVVLS